MKVLFLDFDGVLNNAEFCNSSPHGANRQDPVFDPAKIDLVNELLGRTGAVVVVSSSWRSDGSLVWLREVLSVRGFTGKVIDKTPELSGSPRSDEIDSWLRSRAGDMVTQYVILDDDDDACIEGHFVHTSLAIGLTSELVERAVEILGEVF